MAQPRRILPGWRLTGVIALLAVGWVASHQAAFHDNSVVAGEPSAAESLWKKLEPFANPPEEFAGKLGAYRSPLQFADGSVVKTAADWARRRDEIAKTW